MPTTADSTQTTQSPANAAPLGKTLPPHLQKAMSRMNELSSLPEITTRIIQVVEDPKSAAQDMHDIVKNDPALATRILKVVNSAFYGLPSQIASLDRAIIMLGLSAVKNIALASSLAQLFRGNDISEHFAARDLWRHCIGVGVCSRILAKRAAVALADEYFVAGLVHDMGLLVIGQLFPDALREVAQRCYAEPRDYRAAELEAVGADHEVFGATLAAKWKFPPALRYAIAYHHDPNQLNPELRRIVTFIYVADTICGKMKHGYYLTAQTQEITADMMETIQVAPEALAGVYEELPEQVEDAEMVLAEA